jgi:ferritin-like metal-binding protein YciE
MGQTDVARLLSENLAQEEKTAKTLETAMPELLAKAMKTASKAA